MSFKNLSNRVTSKVGRQVLTVRKHSPVMLFAAGMVGVGTTVVLACRATLKLSDVLEEGEKNLVEADNSASESTQETEKVKLNVRLQTGIKIAKLYAPSVIVGVASVGAMTGSHVILSRRNAAVTAAYAIVQKSYDDYRQRVIAEHGAEKDFEYKHGLVEREIVEEGPNGPEVKTVKGLDPEAIKAGYPSAYARIFDEMHPDWSKDLQQNSFRIQSIQNHANDLLKVNGYVFLNDVYDMLGFERTQAGQQVGWVKNSAEGDGYIDFGVWSGGVFQGKEWVRGSIEGIMLDFNVDGVVYDLLKKV